MKIRAFLFLLLATLIFPKEIAAQNKQEFEVNGVRFRMVKVEGGPFRMTGELVAVVSTFSIGETEVTQELWQAVMGDNPGKFEGPRLPISNVSWNGCQKFLAKLNELTGKNFRLPTEAEWTYAAIGGKFSKGYAYSGSNNINEVAWWARNDEAYTNFLAKKGSMRRLAGKISLSEPQNVATRKPNELGIYDMTGNVWEWCQDWYLDSLPTGVLSNPAGPEKGKMKSFRGGCWKTEEETSQIAFRNYGMPNTRYEDVGLRLLLAE